MKLTDRQINCLGYLEQIFLLLNQYNIRFFLDAGTLLKFKRYKKIYPSTDIDLGFYYEDKKKILNLSKRLISKGYKIKLQNGFPIFEDNLRVYFPNSYRGNSKHVDFYLYKKSEKYLYLPRIHKPDKKSFFSTYLYYSINKIHKKNLLFNSKLIKNFNRLLINLYISKAKKDYYRFKKKYLIYLKSEKLNFKNLKLKIYHPLMVKKYLRERYGADWMSAPKFNWKNKLTLK